MGYQPLANNLLSKKDQKTELYPLEINYCEKCHNSCKTCLGNLATECKSCFEGFSLTEVNSCKEEKIEKVTEKTITEKVTEKVTEKPVVTEKTEEIENLEDNDKLYKKMHKVMSIKNLFNEK